MKHLNFYILSCCLLFSCVSFAAEYTFDSTQMTELKNKLNGKLIAGDIVYLNDGVYTDFQVIFKGDGTLSQPITLKAKNKGKVILTGKLNLKIGGSYLIVDGLTFKDGMAASSDIIEFRTNSTTFANNCRLTNSVMDNCNNPDEKYREGTDESERWVMLYGKNNRVDHCYFTNKINGGVLMMISLDNENSKNNNHIIDYNFFSNRPLFTPGNNAEIIRIGDSKTSQSSSQTIIENNFFYACDGEVEIISIKSCDNLISKNIFYESQGSVVCRHGHRNTIESNAFIGNNKSNCGGVRIINEGHKVYNNFFQELKGTGNRSALCVMMAIFDTPTSSTNTDKEPLNAYHQVRNVEIAYNTFVACDNIDLGTNVNYTYPSSNPYFPSKKVVGTLKPEAIIAFNTFFNPTKSGVINLVDGNASKLSYNNNLYNFKSATSINGFVSRSLEYKKVTSGAGKGIYVLENSANDILNPATSGGNTFTYVTQDISANTRNEVNCGAQKFVNRNAPFSTPRISQVGVNWYNSQQIEVNAITAKTDFWEGSPSSITSEQKGSATEVIKIDRNSVKVSSSHFINEVRVFNTYGQTISSHKIKDYSGIINCSNLSSGIYIFRVKTVLNEDFSRKVFI